MLQLLKPKIRPDSAITQSEAGGLSVVMKLEESSEPKKNAFQLWVAACDRGGVEAVRVARRARGPTGTRAAVSASSAISAGRTQRSVAAASRARASADARDARRRVSRMCSSGLHSRAVVGLHGRSSASGLRRSLSRILGDWLSAAAAPASRAR